MILNLNEEVFEVKLLLKEVIIENGIMEEGLTKGYATVNKHHVGV